MDVVLTFLVYPGLVLTILLALLMQELLIGRVGQPVFRFASLWNSPDGIAGLVSILAAACALALAPAPLHPGTDRPWVGNPAFLVPALEVAFLTPILLALIAPAPFVARAAVREAQIAAAGRVVIYLALGTILWSGLSWNAIGILARLVAMLAAVAAIPAALYVGPFGAETSLAAGGIEEGLHRSTTALLRFARVVRGTAIVAIVCIAPLHGLSAYVRPQILVAIAGSLFVIILLALRRFLVDTPRLPLPTALRWCWWRALPLALVALALVSIGS